MPKQSDEEAIREIAAALPDGMRTKIVGSLLRQANYPMRALAAMGPCTCGVPSCIGSAMTDAAAQFVATINGLIAKAKAPPAEAVSLDAIVSKLGEIRDAPLTVDAPAHPLGCECDVCVSLEDTAP